MVQKGKSKQSRPSSDLDKQSPCQQVNYLKALGNTNKLDN